ncbi:MAG: Fic family protein [Phycisphaerales bacterium JB039]
MRVAQPPDFRSTLAGAETVAAFSDPRYIEVARRCEAKYRHWDKARFLAREAGLDPETLWGVIKIGRLARYRDLPLSDRAGRPLGIITPDAVQRELMLIDQQLAGQLLFDDASPVTAEQRDRFIISALMEEAIASSKLEGASTTVRVAKDMLRKARRPRDRSEQMIVNNYRAIGFVREHSDSPLSMDMLLEVQRILTENTLDNPDEAGRLRRPDERVVVQDNFGETLHEPPPAADLPSRIERICQFASAPITADEFIHPVVRAAALHFQIAYDHPFCDGNGRTARAIFYWSMLRAGYWLFEFLPISRLIYASPGQYGRAFLYTETDDFDFTYFLVYHTRIIAQARRDLADYLSRKRSQQAAARRLFGEDRLNERQRTLLMRALEHKDAALTIEAHQRASGVSYYTARADLLGLESLGYLQKRSVGRRFEFLPADRLNDLMK